jgi:hypothetical protein
MKTEGRTGIAQDKSDHARKHERRAGPTSWATNQDPGLKIETKAFTGSPLSGRKIFSRKSKTRAKKKPNQTAAQGEHRSEAMGETKKTKTTHQTTSRQYIEEGKNQFPWSSCKYQT